MGTILKGPWSYSRATACARALHMEKVLRAPSEPRPERFISIDRRAFGSILHLGAEQILKAVIAEQRLPDFKTLAQDLLKHEERGNRVFFHLSPIVDEIEHRLMVFGNSFRCDWDMDVVERDAIIRDQVLGSEMRLAMDGKGGACSFDDCPETGWRGIVDYAEVEGRRLTVIDFKNRPAIFSKAELLQDEQLSCYLHLVTRQYPGQYDEYRVGIYYFEFGYTQIVDLTKDQLVANVRSLHARARAKEALEKEDLGPEPGFGKCQYCDYLASCDAGREYVHGGQLVAMDVDGAQQLANWVMVTDEKLKAAKASLKMFTGEFGPVTLDDKTLVGFSIDDSGVIYDKNTTLRCLNGLIKEGRLEAKLADFTTLNTTEVKKAVKRAEVFEALAPARTPKVDTKFDFFKPVKRRGVRTQKEGRKTVVHADDRQPPTEEAPRQTRGRVKAAGGKK